MQVNFGRDSNTQKPLIWNSDSVVNGHVMLVGMSGSGKTHFIRKIIRTMLPQAADIADFKVHVFDVHEDIDLGSDGISEVQFSESADYGMNPLIINPDPDYGGVRKTIANFINTINKTSHKLGSRQEPLVRRLLEDLYAANGYFADQPESWYSNQLHGGKQKKVPTLKDLHRWGKYQLKKTMTGADSRCAANLETLNASVRKFRKSLKENATESESQLSQLIEKHKQDLCNNFSTYVHSINTGNELDDIIKYSDKNRLESVLDAIENLMATGIFKAGIPPFNPNEPIHRYRIKPFTEDERKLFVLFRLRNIFRRALSTGLKDYIDTVIVLDEAHIYIDDDEENIVNIISKEARKFGIMIIAASQNPKHFSETFLSSVATKVILGIDEMHWNDAQRKMRVSLQQLERISLQHTILVQIKNKMDSKAEFIPTLV